MKFPIYLDNHASTPLDTEVFEAMRPYFLEKFGNASSKNHSFGWEADSAIKKSREIISDFINAEPSEIYFTSGATESINLAHFGLAEANFRKGNHIISSITEHSASYDSLNLLRKKGFDVTFLPVNNEGIISPDAVRKAVTEKTVFVSIMTANNEIGTINNITAIGEICREKNIIFHTDATQAIGKVEFNVLKNNIDLASFSAHKIYGPKGAGAIFIKDKIKVTPQIFGGGQEKGLRSGTLNVTGIVGLGKAVEILKSAFEEENNRIRNLRDKLYYLIKSELNEVILNGSSNHRLPGNLNICFPGIRAENLIMNMREIAISTGAACASESLKPSRILKALGLSDELALSAIRIGIGKFNNEEQIEYTADKLIKTVKKLKKENPAYQL